MPYPRPPQVLWLSRGAQSAKEQLRSLARLQTAAALGFFVPVGESAATAHHDLEGIVRDTVENLNAGEPVVGGPTLEDFAPGVVRLLCKWWGWARKANKEEPTEDTPEEKEERRSQADRLIGYALKDVEALFVDQHGAPHALVGEEALPLNSRCHSWLRGLMWEHEERAVNGEYLKIAAGTLAAHAEFSGEVRDLRTRAAWHEDALYYELGSGRVVKVDAGGRRFDPDPPVLFRRHPNLKPLPDPQPGDDAKALAGYANLKTNRDMAMEEAKGSATGANSRGYRGAARTPQKRHRHCLAQSARS